MALLISVLAVAGFQWSRWHVDCIQQQSTMTTADSAHRTATMTLQRDDSQFVRLLTIHEEAQSAPV